MNYIKIIEKKVLKDVRIKMAEEFDRNFERQAFFNRRWKASRGGGHTLLKTGRLRRSLLSRVEGNNIRFSSDAPYAKIHNKGGKIPITPKMRRFFLFKFHSTKDTFYYNMSRHKANKITMPKRQFIGYHRALDKPVNQTIEHVLDREAKELFKQNEELFKRLRRH
ncbi:MAG: phage virion morphogenesis protein [Rikenellaceae bacterium]